MFALVASLFTFFVFLKDCVRLFLNPYYKLCKIILGKKHSTRRNKIGDVNNTKKREKGGKPSLPWSS